MFVFEQGGAPLACLNESPYEKVGKFILDAQRTGAYLASMKVPTKK